MSESEIRELFRAAERRVRLFFHKRREARGPRYRVEVRTSALPKRVVDDFTIVRALRIN